MSIAIVTDSSARFARLNVINQYNIHVLPNTVEVGRHRWPEDANFSLEEMLRAMSDGQQPVRVHPPSIDDFAALYRRLVQSHSAILSLHPSQALSSSYANARAAAAQVQASSCPIAVIDTRTICAAQGILVGLAAELVEAGRSLPVLLDDLRSALERVYSIYYVESLEYLRRNGIISDSRAILGQFLGIKPILTIDDGQLKVTEKVRTRGQAIDQLVEFLTEFDAVEDVVILQPRLGMTEQARTIQDRLSIEWVGHPLRFTTYCAAMAAFIGTEAGGVVVLESECDYDDEFSED